MAFRRSVAGGAIIQRRRKRRTPQRAQSTRKTSFLRDLCALCGDGAFDYGQLSRRQRRSYGKGEGVG